MNIERRLLPIEEVRLSVSEDDKPIIEGYAAVFNKDSVPIAGLFVERIKPGAFKRTLENTKEIDVVAAFNHDMNIPLGRRSKGTVEAFEDKHGLKVRIYPPDTTAGKDLVVNLKRGDVLGMSFGFSVPDGGDIWERGARGALDLRTLVDVDLYDVGPATMPAYPDTSVAVRSRQEWLVRSTPVESIEHRKRRNELEAIAV